MRRHVERTRSRDWPAQAWSAAFLFSSTPARAQGFGLYEQGACMMGRAGAGVAAPCDDGSSAFFNPAGLALDTGTVISAGITGIAPRGTFTDSTTKQVSTLNTQHVPGAVGVFRDPRRQPRGRRHRPVRAVRPDVGLADLERGAVPRLQELDQAASTCSRRSPPASAIGCRSARASTSRTRASSCTGAWTCRRCRFPGRRPASGLRRARRPGGQRLRRRRTERQRRARRRARRRHRQGERQGVDSAAGTCSRQRVAIDNATVAATQIPTGLALRAPLPGLPGRDAARSRRQVGVRAGRRAQRADGDARVCRCPISSCSASPFRRRRS